MLVKKALLSLLVGCLLTFASTFLVTRPEIHDSTCPADALCIWEGQKVEKYSKGFPLPAVNIERMVSPTKGVTRNITEFSSVGLLVDVGIYSLIAYFVIEITSRKRH